MADSFQAGGPMVVITFDATGERAELRATPGHGPCQVRVHNAGDEPGTIIFGDSDVTCGYSNGHYTVDPGVEVFTIPSDVTHCFGITESGKTSEFRFTLGNGG